MLQRMAPDLVRLFATMWSQRGPGFVALTVRPDGHLINPPTYIDRAHLELLTIDGDLEVWEALETCDGEVEALFLVQSDAGDALITFHYYRAPTSLASTCALLTKLGPLARRHYDAEGRGLTLVRTTPAGYTYALEYITPERGMMMGWDELWAGAVQTYADPERHWLLALVDDTTQTARCYRLPYDGAGTVWRPAAAWFSV
jgi:hypothetical protein